MKVTIQRKAISAGRTQLQLSYTVNGRRRQTIVPGAVYAQTSSKREREAAQRLAEGAAQRLTAQLDGKSVPATVRRYAAAADISSAKRTQLIRVAELWEKSGSSSAPISDLTAPDVAKFVLSLNKYSANTRRSYIAQTLWVLSQEQQRGNLTAERYHVLTSAAAKPGAEKDNRPYIEPDDIEKLFAAVAPKGFEYAVDAFMLSYYTGLRYSDIRQLTPANITADYIRIAMHKTGGNVTIPINAKARAILDRNPRLFGMLPAQTTQVNRIVGAWAKSAGVEATHPDGSRSPITFHAARHSCATGLLNKGVPIEQVSALLGHKNIATTQVYAKIISKTLTAAVALL